MIMVPSRAQEISQVRVLLLIVSLVGKIAKTHSTMFAWSSNPTVVGMVTKGPLATEFLPFA